VFRLKTCPVGVAEFVCVGSQSLYNHYYDKSTTVDPRCVGGPTTKSAAQHRRERRNRGNARTLVKVAESSQLLALHHSAQQGQTMYQGGYTWGPIGGQADWAWTQGGKGQGKHKGKGKGMGPSPYQGKGKGKGQSLAKENRELDKSMKQLHKKIALLEKQAKGSEVNSRETPAKEIAPIVPIVTEKDKAKPTMYNSKGQQLDVAWICSCGQQHWSAKVKACVACKAAKTAWATVPGGGGQQQEPAVKEKLMGPFKNSRNLSWFQQLGLLKDEVESAEGNPGTMEEEPQPQITPDKRDKAERALRELKAMGADQHLIQMAQDQLDANPQPKEVKPSQECFDMAKVKTIQGQLVDAFNREQKEQQEALAKMQAQLEALQKQVAEQVKAMEVHQQSFQKFHQACQSAVALKSTQEQVKQDPTTTQVTAGVLASQLRKAEDPASAVQMQEAAAQFGVQAEQLMKIMHFAYSGAITGAAWDETKKSEAAAQEQAPAPQAAEAAQSMEQDIGL
jgi:hypothetical protein